MAPLSATGLSVGRKVIVLDTETTGLLPYDRMISLAALRFEGEAFVGDLHRIYDPRKDSHPGALSVHGWDDWMLRFQDLFADDAEDVREWLAWADLLVMHNAAFDMRYVARELRKAEAAPIETESYCTMEAARLTWRGSAKLDDCLARIGMRRTGNLHGAYEDAFLTACLYFHLQGSSFRPMPPAQWPEPTNLRHSPPRPEGALPRRATKKRGKAPPAAFIDHGAMGAVQSRANDGLAILRYLATVGEVNEVAQADIIDAYVEHVLNISGHSMGVIERMQLVAEAVNRPAPEADAMDAAGRIGRTADDVIALGPLIVAMVKADGTASECEADAVRNIIDAIRLARKG